ncbi:MAG: ribokinase [Clostridia bacterium]|nr:ribokinase [Clostridia bacterium]MBQ3076906.1 ribokinase [Clostridia bacterium]
MNSQQKSICVIGSINADLSMRVPRFVAPGETLRGSDFQFSPGGKGANQAAAAGRLGGRVTMIGRMGSDPFGADIARRLRECSVNCDSVECDESLATGTAIILVEESGQNAICIAAGANATVTPEYLKRVKAQIDNADIVLLQLEIPMETNLWAAEYCARQGKLVMLDPAPAAPLSDDLLRYVSVLTPNETELTQLTGLPVTDLASRKAACRALHTLGVKTVINKAGPDGVYVYTGDDLVHYPTYEVEVADTTAAGDTFNGAFAVALAQGIPFAAAIDMANLAAALSTTGFGAQTAMPTDEELTRARKELRHKEG